MSQKERNADILPRASSSDFESIDLSSLLATLKNADVLTIESALRDELREVNESGNDSPVKALVLLITFCTFHLQVEDPGPSFVPRWTSADGVRSCKPSDFRGEQNDVMAAIVPAISHPALRARVADVVWFNDRKQWEAGNAAVSAYCEIVEMRMNGTFAPVFEGLDESLSDAVDFLHRALQIAASSGKRGKLPTIVHDTFAKLYVRVTEQSRHALFVRLARLGGEYLIMPWRTFAEDAEALADAAGDGFPPWALRPLWRLAADAYGRLNDDDAKRRCVSRMVDQTLRNREYVSQAAARASWTRDAIEELRQVPGFQERIRELRSELRDHQEEAVDETTQFSIPFDLTKERAGTVKLFEDLTLPDALLQLGIITSPPKISELRAAAEQSRRASGLGAMFGSQYTDVEGKVIAQTAARSLDGKARDAHLKEEYVRILDLHRHRVVHGYLEPARRTVMARFPLEERHFQPIADASPFVPPGHNHLFCLGFARFWQGDYASAVHLLVPQIENSIRYVLLNSNQDSSKMSRDLLQEDRSLSGLLENFREEMDRVFGEDLTNDLELLFVHKPGPALRHELAHGKLYDALCYEADAIYACWFVFFLTIFPLSDQWGAMIAPAIEDTAL
ncbi:DUF4209 domain-containing protein [Paraburkholderia sediminicola]|uniref:DUF4209 domain-containing protein n=1 Tax=Paraburkholderia sediminicola TaxID=458836 RepID=UPI0038BA34D2